MSVLLLGEEHRGWPGAGRAQEPDGLRGPAAPVKDRADRRLSPTLPAPTFRPCGQHSDATDHDLARGLVHDRCSLRMVDRGPGAFGADFNHLVNALIHQVARVARRSAIERRAATTWKADPTATSASQRHGRYGRLVLHRDIPPRSSALHPASDIAGQNSWRYIALVFGILVVE